MPESAPGRPALPDPAAVQACLPGLTHALTIYLGPVAGLLVRRHASNIADLTKLVESLAQEIPTKGERQQFLNRVQQIVTRHRH
jgi:hypothetical protein